MDPPTKETTLVIGFINIHGQSKLSQAKQNLIDHLVKTNKVDVLHMQESNIKESSFEFCPFISSNYLVSYPSR